MKILKLLFGTFGLSVILFLTICAFSACTKEDVRTDTVTVHDTTTICGCADKDPNVLKGLIAYFTFTNGSLADSSGHKNNIVENNAAVSVADRFGNPNGAYLFNGTSSYMRVADSASLTPDTAITMTAIFKLNNFYTGNCSGNQIFGKENADYTQGLYCLRVTDFGSCGSATDTSKENLYGSFGDYSGDNVSGTEYNPYFIKPGIWYNVVFTYGSDTSKLYINGTLITSNVKHGSIAADNGFDLFLGKLNDNTFPYYLNGVLDEVRIYNRAICAAEVTKLNNLTQ